jgi:hypothetical protein
MVRRSLLAMTLLLSTQMAAAQTPATIPRIAVRIDAGAQTAPKAFADEFDVALYTEQEHVAIRYPGRGGPFFSAEGRYRVWKGLTIALGVSRFTRDTDAEITASVPHPFFDDRFRAVEGTTPVRREETATHVAAGWLLPLGGVSLTVSAGPVFMSARQLLVSSVAIAETYPYDTADVGSAEANDARRRGTGVYAGADVAWMFSRHVGAGGIIQFTHAPVRQQVGDRTLSIDAGGLQGGGGIRFAF